MKTSIGLQTKVPSTSCNDKKCPFHGSLSVHGNIFTGTVVSAKRHNTITVEWSRRHQLPKYERYEKRNTKISVHNPECIAAKEGDMVRIINCRPLSKTKNFVVIENLGHVFGFEERMEALAEAKVKEKQKKAEEFKKAEEDKATKEQDKELDETIDDQESN